MGSDEIRKKYLKFFEERGHVRINHSPLVLENDPTTLFTSSGMQQLVPYLKGEPHPKGKRLVDSQPSFRTQDIDEVGDTNHLTYFEMLGNWSLGDYFKKEQLTWCLEFFTEELGFPKEKLYVSVFEGTKGVPKDTDSAETWKGLGIPDERIFYYGVDKNWWSRSGTPEDMPAGEIGGPDSEVFFDFGTPHNHKYGEKCHPNCQCGRFIEIGNSVFIQYKKKSRGELEELPQKNVDFGGGLERIAAAVKGTPDIFETDLFSKIIERVEEFSDKKYEGENKNPMRVIADHLKASTLLIGSGVAPSNKAQGYVLRRLLRRAAVKMHELRGGLTPIPAFEAIADSVLETYDDVDFGFAKDRNLIERVIEEEMERFGTSLDRGLAVLEKTPLDKLTSEFAFDLYQSYGFPYEISEELFRQKGKKLDRDEFDQMFVKHQEQSRTASVGMFKGGLADTSKEVVKLHTATHLIHAALRKVLGGHVSQKGSNITAERLRFDFSYPQKLSEDEIKKVEDLVNAQIKKDLPVSFEEKSRNEALKEGALAFFGEKYGEKVKVYTIGDFSKEVCGGPHVAHTGEVGRVRIVKQEKLGSGVARIYATAE